MKFKNEIQDALGLVAGRRYQEAMQALNEIVAESEDDPQSYYWALKHMGDITGYAGFKDYFSAIDIYQKIINEYEIEDDQLYEWCQMDIMRSYVELGIEMFDSFNGLTDVVMPVNDVMDEYFQKIIEKKKMYIEVEAEKLFKERL